MEIEFDSIIKRSDGKFMRFPIDQMEPLEWVNEPTVATRIQRAAAVNLVKMWNDRPVTYEIVSVK